MFIFVSKPNQWCFSHYFIFPICTQKIPFPGPAPFPLYISPLIPRGFVALVRVYVLYKSPLAVPGYKLTLVEGCRCIKDPLPWSRLYHPYMYIIPVYREDVPLYRGMCPYRDSCMGLLIYGYVFLMLIHTYREVCFF